jgi:hypothetical protein
MELTPKYVYLRIAVGKDEIQDAKPMLTAVLTAVSQYMQHYVIAVRSGKRRSKKTCQTCPNRISNNE